MDKEAIDLNITQPAPFKGISQILTEHYEQKDSVQYFSTDTYYDTKKFDLLKKVLRLELEKVINFIKLKKVKNIKEKELHIKQEQMMYKILMLQRTNQRK